MTQEERTRDEVLQNLAAQSLALISISASVMAILEMVRALLDERGITVSLDKIRDTMNAATAVVEKVEAEVAPKKARAKKVAAPQPEPLGPPLTNPAEMNPEPPKQMADIKPTKPGKTLADLRIALQECINKHGMPGAKERLAPFAKISDVPEAEITNVITRLSE